MHSSDRLESCWLSSFKPGKEVGKSQVHTIEMDVIDAFKATVPGISIYQHRPTNHGWQTRVEQEMFFLSTSLAIA